jgi:hypothetical protein
MKRTELEMSALYICLFEQLSLVLAFSLLVNLGSEDACHCGCRGWCTYFPLLLALAWDLNACAVGVHNSLNQYDESFTTNSTTERRLAQQAGTDMGIVVVTLDAMTDWPAWTSWTGMRQWNHNRSPCPKCDISKSVMYSEDSIKGVSLENGPWIDYSHEQYDQDLSSALVATWFL